jgi:methylase of polypeptide subunit release factors
LSDFEYTLKRMEGDKNIKNILDLGCGSGILSFLCKKSFKKAKVVAFDCNKAAVDTTNVNAAEHHFDDITAYQFDLTKSSEFK